MAENKKETTKDILDQNLKNIEDIISVTQQGLDNISRIRSMNQSHPPLTSFSSFPPSHPKPSSSPPLFPNINSVRSPPLSPFIFPSNPSTSPPLMSPIFLNTLPSSSPPIIPCTIPLKSNISIPEPPPNPNGVPIYPFAIKYLQKSIYPEGMTKLLEERYEFGLQKYKQPLMSNDGRDSFEDTRQEIGDMFMYLSKIRYQLDNELDQEKIKKMRGELMELYRLTRGCLDLCIQSVMES